MGTNKRCFYRNLRPKKGRKGWSLGEALRLRKFRASVPSGSPLFLTPARHPVVCIRGECFAVSRALVGSLYM